ncbi:MAG: WbqC family protein [Alphaproteobacteria bacterium]
MGLTVAIHQPNYVPWLGYFAKIARADLFVFLDDVQFSKNSYINRVQVLGNGAARWLTVPVSVHLGQTIAEVRPAQPGWEARHLDTLRGSYRQAAHFRDIWPLVNTLYADLPGTSIAASNRMLVERIAELLGLTCRFTASSEIATENATSDTRLARIVAAVAPEGTYLSGRGGAAYQSPDTFARAGLSLAYTDFQHPAYVQSASEFIGGLSVLDALFHCGIDAVSRFLRP